MNRPKRDSLFGSPSCTGKRRYASQGDALDAAATLGLERHRQAYHCPLCGKWHLTSHGPRRTR